MPYQWENKEYVRQAEGRRVYIYAEQRLGLDKKDLAARIAQIRLKPGESEDLKVAEPERHLRSVLLGNRRGAWNHPLTTTYRDLICKALACSVAEFGAILGGNDDLAADDGGDAGDAAYKEIRVYVTKGLRPAIPEKMDRKNVLMKLALSARILKNRPPTLAECVAKSCKWLTPTAAHKDIPYSPDLPYNHFLQVAAVIEFCNANPAYRARLTYSREEVHDAIQQFRLGNSCLWAASFDFRERGRDKAMDEWMEMVAGDPEAAAEEFIRDRDSILSRLLKYKIDLHGSEPVGIRPWGVVTNDLHAAGKAKRVYSQYVFRVTVNVNESWRDLVAAMRNTKQPRILANVDSFGLLPEGTDERLYFRDKNGSPNLMDIVVWRSLTSSAKCIREGSATFVRGFDLCRLPGRASKKN